MKGPMLSGTAFINMLCDAGLVDREDNIVEVHVCAVWDGLCKLTIKSMANEVLCQRGIEFVSVNYHAANEVGTTARKGDGT